MFTKTGKPRKHSSCLDPYKDEIIRLLTDGISKIDIARRFGMSKQTLHRFVYLNQLESSFSYRLKSSERKIAEIFRKDVSSKEVAEKMDLGYKRMGKYVAALVGKNELILKMHNAGIATSVIAKTFECPIEIIRTRLRRMGINMDNHGRTITA